VWIFRLPPISVEAEQFIALVSDQQESTTTDERHARSSRQFMMANRGRAVSSIWPF
jgi:hypothetical protein